MAIIDKIQLSGTVYTIGNETTTAVTSASTDNEIPTAKAVYDAIPQGGGGGGKAVSGGTNISITTGETADTINCTLPISGGTGTNALIYNSTINVASGDYSHSEGYISKAEGYASHAEGLSTKSKGFGSHAEGYFTITTNESEHSSGRYNNSVSSSTTFGNSGNTLFSVGNGTADNARHNAFEIRQNGDIYISKDGQDVKLQDQLGGGGSSYTAGDGIDINNDVISVTGKVDTSTYETYTAATDTALASKQTTLTAGTGISIVDNVISATGGGGKAIEAGTNISITTGETADTINCTLPIVMNNSNMSINSNIGFANNLSNCFTFGAFNTVGNGNKCSYLFTFGSDNNMSASNINRQYRYAFGTFLRTQNSGEIAFSKYNVSSSASETFGDSGNTLFSVGNGTSSSKRHNAFEIRQNGDIYITKDGQDVKLQDQLGGGGGSITIDPSLDSGSTNPVANSAITTAINDRQLKREYVGSEKVFTSEDSRVINGKRFQIIHPVFRCYSNNDTNTELVLNNKDLGLYFPQINGKNIFSTNINDVNFLTEVLEPSAITTSVSSESTDSQVPSAKAVYDQLGGLKLVKLTKSEYDSLSTKDNSTLYVIVN